jgi:PAS domain S-box-containing protein
VPLRDETGKVHLLVATNEDVTVQKTAEVALRESEARYRHLFDANKDPLFLADAHSGKLVDANLAACQTYGYSHGELTRLNNTDLSAEPAKTRQSMREQQDLVPLRYHRRKDGTVFPVELMINRLVINGQAMAVVAARDITERLEASRRLQEKKQRLELAIWGANLGMWDWNVQNNTLVFNEIYAGMLGYAPGELRQEPDTWTRLLHPDDREPVNEALRLHLAGHPGYYQAEHRLRGKDGGWVWVLGSGKVIDRDEAGRPLRMVGINMDITRRKASEFEIKKLNEELEQKVEERTAQLQAVNKELEAFSYSVSHDLRSPLRSIDGFSKMLLLKYEPLLDEDGKDYLHTIRAAAQRMGLLIDDLLKLSKVSRAELRRFEVDVSAMAQEVLQELARETPGRTVTCRVTPGLVAWADHRLLHIALQNLLSNAWKYSSKRAAATIEVGRTTTPRGEAFFVKDNGAGFDMGHAGKLFGAFQRLHGSQEFEGTGIGLAIVHRIMVKHGGEIWVEAAPDQGATFFFILPAP